MKQCHSKMPNPVSVEMLVTSDRRFGSNMAPFAWGKARGHVVASAEHCLSSHRGSLMRSVLAVPHSEGRDFEDSIGRCTVACGGMLSNMSFERAVGHRGPRLARQSGRRAAAQLDR